MFRRKLPELPRDMPAGGPSRGGEARKKWNSQIRKGTLELCMLAAVADRSRYGFDLIQHLDERGVAMTDGTLYPLLNRLQGEGLVTADWQESAAGPPRKYYTLTAEGREALAWMRDDWRALVASLDKVLGAPEQAAEKPGGERGQDC